MSKIKKRMRAFLSINVIVCFFVILLIATAVISIVYENNIFRLATLFLAALSVALETINISMYSSRYSVICKELSCLVSETIKKQDKTNVKVACSIASKTHYFIVSLSIKGKTSKEAYSKCTNIVNSYIEEVEVLLKKACLLNINTTKN